MKCRAADLSRSLAFQCLILLVLGLQVCPGAGNASAEDAGLQEQQPITDQRSSQTSTQTTDHTSTPTSTLKGRVHRDDTDETNADNADRRHQATVETKDNADLHKLSGASSGSGHFGRKMSAAAYRNLNYGVIGIVSRKLIFGSKQTVTEVYPGCPAALAGIRPGDVEVQTDDHVWNREDNQRSNWNITDGKAGTPVDVTIRRHGQLMTFHLIRMNIEDISDDRIRRMFERMLSRLGPPSR